MKSSSASSCRVWVLAVFAGLSAVPFGVIGCTGTDTSVGSVLSPQESAADGAAGRGEGEQTGGAGGAAGAGGEQGVPHAGGSLAVPGEGSGGTGVAGTSAAGGQAASNEAGGTGSGQTPADGSTPDGAGGTGPSSTGAGGTGGTGSGGAGTGGATALGRGGSGAGGAAGTANAEAGANACASDFASALVKTCTSAADCVLVRHNDCCGTVVMAVRSGTQGSFTAADQAYQSCVPGCGLRGCHHADVDEQGAAAEGTTKTIVAECNNQTCASVVR